jgi:hypothetical protein
LTNAGTNSIGGLITQSTQDGTGPAVNNPALNNIADGAQAIFGLVPALDLLEDDRATDIQASVTTYSGSNVGSATVPEPAPFTFAVPRAFLDRVENSQEKNQMKTTLFALATFLLPACAFAADGQILINQSTIMAAGGFPYVISQPGSYKLSGNLIVPNGVSGISITANNVTLDLNGFSMTGAQQNFSGSPQTALIQSGAVIGATVRNGTLAGNSPNLFLNFYLATGSVFEDLTIYQNFGSGNQSWLGAFVIVRRVNATTSGITVRCPALITDSLADAFSRDFSLSPVTSCNFGPFSGRVF